MIGGTASGAGTGATFIDYVITDNLGTTNKNGTGSQHDGGTFVTDITVVRVTATTADTTTFRAQPRLGGVIGAGLTVRIDYLIWID